MTRYVYIPFPSAEMDQMASAWEAGRRNENKEPPTFIRKRTSLTKIFSPQQRRNQLGMIQPDDKLYVMAHGNRDAISANIDGGKSYDPATLARKLEERGLPKNCKDVRIFACNSADGDADSFADRLKAQMQQRGYSEVQVCGYHGEVYPQYGKRYNSQLDRISGLHKGAEFDTTPSDISDNAAVAGKTMRASNRRRRVP